MLVLVWFIHYLNIFTPSEVMGGVLFVRFLISAIIMLPVLLFICGVFGRPESKSLKVTGLKYLTLYKVVKPCSTSTKHNISCIMMMATAASLPQVFSSGNSPSRSSRHAETHAETRTRTCKPSSLKLPTFS